MKAILSTLAAAAAQPARIATYSAGDGQPRAHPAADLFPMMNADDLAALTEHIREHGLREPIVVDDGGLIVDGRNRWLACRLAGVEPRTVRLSGADALALVRSTNARRREAVDQGTAWNRGGQAVAASGAEPNVRQRSKSDDLGSTSALDGTALRDQ